MKASRSQIESALRAPNADLRFFLLYGPDEAGSRSLIKLLGAALGEGAERVDIVASELRSDPARLSDEAASISLFGDPRYILVENAGEEVVPAVEALLEAPSAGNPVVILAGALRPTSRLLKLALGDPAALAFASYVPDAREAERLVLDLSRQHGLVLRSDVARRLAEAAGGNRSLIERELEKYAAFVDAAPDRPQPLDHDAVDALGAGDGEGDLSRLVDSVAGGDARMLQAELLRLSSQGVDGIILVRAMLRRMLLLAKLRAEVERGNAVDAVMASQGKALFWKDKPVVSQQLSRWRSDLLAKATARLLDTERQVKAPGGLGSVVVDEELFAICRQAARMK